MSIWGNDADRYGTGRMQFNGQTGINQLVDRERADDGGWISQIRELPIGAHFVADYGKLYTGPILFAKTKVDMSKLRPYGQPQLEASGDYKEGFRFPVYSRDFGLRLYANNAVSVQFVLRAMLDDFEFSPEAWDGKLAAYEIEQAESRFNAEKGAAYFVPRYRRIGWVPRREDVFGPRIVPAPKQVAPLVLPTASSRPAIPVQSAQAAQAPLQQQQPSPTPAPKQAPELDDEIPF